MKKKRNKLLPPSLSRKNLNKNDYYKNKVKSMGFSVRKIEAAKKRLMKSLKIDEFALNDLFFTSVLRWKNFGESNTSLEMAISKILISARPLSFNLHRDVLIVHNHTKSIVIFLYEDNGVLMGSTANLASVGYFHLDKPEYSQLFKTWKKQAMDSTFEDSILGEAKERS